MSTGVAATGQSSAVTSVGGLPIASLSSSQVTCEVVLPPFHEIYNDHFDFVWRTARRLGVPEATAEDVVQDAFLVLHRRLAEYDGRVPLKRWLYGVVVRVVADHRRRYRRKDAPCVPHTSDSDGNMTIASSIPPPFAEVEQQERVRLLHALLAELDEDKRDVLVLSELEELTVPEIAEILSANVNTIYTRLRTARRDFELVHARHTAKQRAQEGRTP